MDRANGTLAVSLIMLAVIAVLVMPRKWRGTGTAHGTARVATIVDLKRAGMLKRGGAMLGQCGDRTLIWMKRVVHTAIFAPSGAGKGVSLIVPWLRACILGSCVITDPKGENYTLTANWRRAMGQIVIRLDPFEVCGPNPDTFNPVDLISEGPEGVDDCRAMSEAWTVRTGEEKDRHFDDQSANMGTGVLSWVVSSAVPEQRNLLSLRDIVSDSELAEGCVKALRKKGGIYARIAGVIAQLEAEEKASVYSTLHRHTTFLDSPAIAKSVAKSSFDARQLLTGRMTIYIILPPHQMEAQARWMRLVLVSLIRMILREGTQENNG